MDKMLKVVINIPENIYRRLKAGDTNAGNTFHNTALESISNGVVLSDEHDNNYPDKSKTCDKCKYYLYRSNEYPCSRCSRNNVLVNEIREQQNDRWKDGTPNG